jgi:PAS domain S-box-containing protein
MKLIKYKKIFLPTITSFISLIVILFLINEYSEFEQGLREKRLKSEIHEDLMSKKSQLEQSLYSRIYFTKSVAAYVSINTDIAKEDFNQLASEFIRGDTVISTMSIAKNCILSVIYPYEGHESAIGLNLLSHPQRKEMVEQSIITGQTFIAGPVELIEGGIAFISYTPVFTSMKKTQENFWGVADIVVYMDKLFNEVGLTESDSVFNYGMKGINGLGNSGEIFWGKENAFNEHSVSVEVLLPTGSWILSATPVNGWTELINRSESLYILLYLSAFIISLLIWLWSRALIKIRSNEKEMKALFGSMEDLIIEFNRKGEYVKVAPTNEKLLVMPRNEIIGKSLHDIFEKDLADFFLSPILECLETKKLVIIDYKLKISGEEMWFRARISYLSENSVIFLAHNNTTQKLTENALKNSEIKLKKINAQKDKFFSIIAHDLRNPLGSFYDIAKLLYDDYDNFDDIERKDFLKLLKESSKNTYELLDNLLEWSRSQKGLIKFSPENVNLRNLVSDNLEVLKIPADNKNIDIINNVAANIVINADINMLNTILRNIISNSIKFSNDNGAIEIGVSKLENNYIEIFVKDNGIGMSEKTLSELFRIDVNVSTKGTKGESGTGLGLILCREFIEKNKGKIWVESKLGAGSTFYFSLPF